MVINAPLGGIKLCLWPAGMQPWDMKEYSMRVQLFATLISGLLLLLGCTSAPASSTVSGTITYRQRMALPPNAVLEVRLLDSASPEQPLNRIIQNPTTQVPIPFALTYASAQINPDHTYEISAEIRQDAQVIFSTSSHYPVITQGNPTHVQVVLEMQP